MYMHNTDTLELTVMQLYDSISTKYKYWLDTHADIDLDSSTEPFTIHTCLLSQQYPDSKRLGLLHSLLEQLQLSDSNTMLSYTEITGSLTEHRDKLTAGPVRTLILLSDNVVCVSQDGVEHTYTRGDTLVLDTSNSHSAIIQDGSSSQRWLIVEDLGSRCTSVAEHFLKQCVYVPLGLR